MDEAELVGLIGLAFQGRWPDRLGLAVSGGSDSLALLYLVREWGGIGSLHVVTVNHGLRSGAAKEAKEVARVCRGLGIPHETIHWRGWDGKGNLQDQARRARYSLMAGWASERNVDTIALGHTLDDQAETFLMRVNRRAGLDGLSGMPVARKSHGITWMRPLLKARRADLRGYLTRRGITWMDDPTNEDPGYDRVRTRAALAALEPAGITIEAIAEVAENLSDAREALELQTYEAALTQVKLHDGDVLISKAGFESLPAEIRRRLMSHALSWVAQSDYGPRRAALAEALGALADGRGSALHGCRVIVEKDKRYRVFREYNAVRDHEVLTGQVWDNRWLIGGIGRTGGHVVRPLGEAGLAECADWRDTGKPAASIAASPAVWKNDTLIAAPMAGFQNGWTAELAPDVSDFFTSILSR